MFVQMTDGDHIRSVLIHWQKDTKIVQSFSRELLPRFAQCKLQLLMENSARKR